MSESLFDVIILNTDTMTVSSIAAYSVRENAGVSDPWQQLSNGRMTAEQVKQSMHFGLAPNMVSVIVPAGEINKGDKMEISC